MPVDSRVLGKLVVDLKANLFAAAHFEGGPEIGCIDADCRRRSVGHEFFLARCEGEAKDTLAPFDRSGL